MARATRSGVTAALASSRTSNAAKSVRTATVIRTSILSAVTEHT